MVNFFAIMLIIFIGFLIIFFKPRNFKNLIKIKRIHPNKFRLDNKNNINYLSNKNSFSYKHEEKKYSEFYKNSQKNKMFTLFKGDTKDKLKALKIAEELADKSTLPILRKGLRDISPEVIEISALLIRKFK
ncbi:annexin [uncultured Prochlorococcus sp.]|uniref:annexin n=1 Tax=uncultured Prochlorococcus sp. TaxID=159733 RepID=UPI002587F257|nr:annexin [uncultured Prochlorococcus sp.]